MASFVTNGISHREYTLEAENFALRQKLIAYKGLVTAMQCGLNNSGISRSALASFVDEELTALDKEDNSND